MGGRIIRFSIPGEALPESKRTSRARPGKDGSVIQGRRYEPADRRDWKANVRAVAAAACSGPPLEGPLSMTITVVKPPAPSWPKRPTKGNPWPWSWWKKPDENNLVKPIQDACRSVVWLDDAQVVRGEYWKVIGNRHLAVVTIREVTQDEADYALAVAMGIDCKLRGDECRATG